MIPKFSEPENFEYSEYSEPSGPDSCQVYNPATVQPGIDEGVFGEIGHVSVQPHAGPGLGILLLGCTTASKSKKVIRIFEVFEITGTFGVFGNFRKPGISGLFRDF